MLAIALCLLLSGQEPAKGQACVPPTPSHRAEVLRVISSGKSPQGYVGFELALKEAMDWYDHGDLGILPSLLKAGRHCDGESSEMFGPWLEEAFLAGPLPILKGASARPRSEQETLGSLLVSGDGGGYAPEEMTRIRTQLDRFARAKDPCVAATARMWLRIFDQFQADQAEE